MLKKRNDSKLLRGIIVKISCQGGSVLSACRYDVSCILLQCCAKTYDKYLCTEISEADRTINKSTITSTMEIIIAQYDEVTVSHHHF